MVEDTSWFGVVCTLSVLFTAVFGVPGKASTIVLL
jgi:hypothetical protein